MKRATELHIDRLRIEGRPLSAAEAQRLARLIAVELAKTPLPYSGPTDRLAVSSPSASIETPAFDRLAAQVAREIRRRLA